MAFEVCDTMLALLRATHFLILKDLQLLRDQLRLSASDDEDKYESTGVVTDYEVRSDRCCIRALCIGLETE